METVSGPVDSYLGFCDAKEFRNVEEICNTNCSAVKSQPVPIFSDPNTIEGGALPVADYKDSRPPDPKTQPKIQGLSFSACGKFCFVSQGDLSDVVDLHSFAIYPKPRAEISGEVHKEDQRKRKADGSPAQVTSDQRARSSEQSILRTGQWEIDPSNPESRKELVVTQEGLVSIRSRDIEGVVRQSASLLELPANIGPTNAVVSLHQPGTQDGIKIILNVPTQVGYSIGDETKEEVLPIIVHRDLSSILVTDSNHNLQLGSKSLLAVEGTSERNEDGEDLPTKKKRYLEDASRS